MRLPLQCLHAAVKTWLFWLLVVPLAFVSGIVSSAWYDHQTGNIPVIQVQAELLTPIIEERGVLMFVVRAATQPGRNCLGQTTREFSHTVDVPGYGKIISVHHDIGPAPIIHQLGEYYRVEIDLPEHVGAGEWTYQGRTQWWCGFLAGIEMYTTPPMEFVVVGSK